MVSTVHKIDLKSVLFYPLRLTLGHPVGLLHIQKGGLLLTRICNTVAYGILLLHIHNLDVSSFTLVNQTWHIDLLTE